jgi:hypothetical protein
MLTIAGFLIASAFVQKMVPCILFHRRCPVRAITKSAHAFLCSPLNLPFVAAFCRAAKTSSQK